MKDLHYLGQTFIFIHSALQPVIYFLTGTKLRCELKRILTFRIQRIDAVLQNDGVSEDEGFSSCKEEDFRETNLTVMRESIQINIEMHEFNNEMKTTSNQKPITPTLSVEEINNKLSNPETERKTSSRKTSFYLDFDPMCTPPPTPRQGRQK